jgi:hypothetical protein
MSFSNENKIITAAVSNIKEMRKKIFNLPVLEVVRIGFILGYSFFMLNLMLCS